MRCNLVTTANIGKGTGGGNVAYYESMALRNVTLKCLVLERRDISPTKWGLPDNEFLYDYFAYQLLRNEIEVDIAHFNGNPFGLTAKKLKENGAKIFVSVPAHNLELSIEEFEHLGIKYPFVHMTNPYLWELYTEHIRIADVIISPSWYSARYIKEKLKLENMIEVIPHGTEIPSTFPPYPQIFTVAHIGVNGPDKGQIYLVKAWNKLITEGLKDAKILLAGHGTETWGGLGYIENPKMVYEQCSVYVQPSVTEGFGIPVLEAMAHGRPVIVTEGCGSSEIVDDKKDGFVVPIRDPDALAEKIRYFYEHPEAISIMGINARKKVEQNFSWDKIRKKYEELYHEVSS